MTELLSEYSLSDVIIFVVMIALAVKELISLIEWFKEKIRKKYDKDYIAKQENQEIKEEIEELEKFYGEKKKIDANFESVNRTFDKLFELVNMLIESDKEKTKALLTEKHHYFVYEQGWIDDYTMDCLEKCFAIYEKENGNSFAEGLMDELRSLPKQPPCGVKGHYDKTARFISDTNKNKK